MQMPAPDGSRLAHMKRWQRATLLGGTVTILVAILWRTVFGTSPFEHLAGAIGAGIGVGLLDLWRTRHSRAG